MQAARYECPVCGALDGKCNHLATAPAGVTFIREVAGMAYVSLKRLYKTLDGAIVEEGSPDAASLLLAANTPVSEAEVKKYGIAEFVRPAGEIALVEPVPDITARVAALEARLAALEGGSEAKVSTKAVAGPPEDKASPAKA